MPFTGHGMTGFENVWGKYWSTWTDSMSTGLMVSEGTCDSSAKTCSFTGSWNDAVKKGPVKARMTSRWTSPTTEVFELYGPGKDGKEMKMMEMIYTKKKPSSPPEGLERRGARRVGPGRPSRRVAGTRLCSPGLAGHDLNYPIFWSPPRPGARPPGGGSPPRRGEGRGVDDRPAAR